MTFKNWRPSDKIKKFAKTGTILGATLALTMSLWVPSQAATYQTLTSTSFNSGSVGGNESSYQGWEVQANPGDISILGNSTSTNKVLKVSINKSENFSNVANGVPRAELQNHNLLSQGSQYLLSWKTYIPSTFQFDSSSNQELFMQIHQTSSQGDGSPPFEVGLAGSQYYFGSYFAGGSHPFMSASTDKGKWVTWNLVYKPSSNKSSAVTQLYKNGQLVVNYIGQNAFSQGQGYMKLGIYKWDWNNVPSKVTNRTLYFDDTSIQKLVS